MGEKGEREEGEEKDKKRDEGREKRKRRGEREQRQPINDSPSSLMFIALPSSLKSINIFLKEGCTWGLTGHCTHS